jgi:hypothetical protein
MQTRLSADFDLDPTADAVIWVKQVEPEAFEWLRNE